MSRPERRAMIVARPPGAEPEPTMPPAVARALLALLPAEGRERGDAGADAPHRRAVPEVSVLVRWSGICAARGCGSGADGPAGLWACWVFRRSTGAPRTSDPHPEHRVWPYLLKDLRIDRPNHVWCADITYIPVRRGFLYLVAVMDWASRHVLAWRLSNTLDAGFCVEALEEALERYSTTATRCAAIPSSSWRWAGRRRAAVTCVRNPP